MIDYQLEDTLYLPFTTRALTGIPTVLSGTPKIDIYEDAGTTQVVVDETLVVDFDAVVGLNMITVTATAASGFEAGKTYTVIIQAGTVDGVSVVGEIVALFTLDMSAAAKDLANVTDGLGALKTLLDAIPTTMRGTDNAALATAVQTVDDEIATMQGNVTDILGDTGGIAGAAMRGTDNAALATVVGALNDGAAAGEVTEADTLMQYLKQLINILIGGPGIAAFPAESAPGNAVSLAEVIRAIHVDVTGLAGSAMRGTDNAGLATVVGALNDAAAAGEVTTGDTLVQYIKQLINILIGGPGIAAFPAEAAPGNAISLAEVIRAIHADVTGLAGNAMRGTNDAALATGVDVVKWNGAAVATPTVAGVPEVDVTHQVGGVVPAPNTTGVPDVNTKEINDAAVVGDGNATPWDGA